MRAVTFLFLVLSLAGCVTTVDLKDRPALQCAATGQMLEGTSSSSFSGGSYSSEYRSLRCHAPKSKDEKCAVQANQEALREVHRHNAEWSSARIATGVGYLFYIVPGIGMYYYWKDENLASLSAIDAASKEAFTKCEMTAH